MKMILKYLEELKKECVLAPLFKMLEALFELFVPLVVASIIDRGIGQQDTAYIVKMCLMLLGLAIIGLVCSITAQYFSAKAAVGCATGIRHALFKHIQSLSFTEMDDIGTSTLMTRMTSDINQVQNGVNLVLRLFLRSPFIVFGAMIMAFTIDVRAALIFVAAIPVLAVIVFGIMIGTRPLYKKVQAGLDTILGITRENLTGVRVIRAFNKQDDELARFKNKNEELNHMQKFVGKISGLMNPLTYTVVNVSIIALIWVGAIRVNQGFGRIGCYLAGCCYGRVTDSAFGVIFPVGSQAPAGVKLIPTQLISAGANIIHMIILIAVAHFIGYTIRKKDGRKLVLPAGGIGYLYMILYGIGRFLIEFLRNDYRGEIGILSTSQFISIFFIAAGVVLLIIGKKKMQS